MVSPAERSPHSSAQSTWAAGPLSSAGGPCGTLNAAGPSSPSTAGRVLQMGSTSVDVQRREDMKMGSLRGNAGEYGGPEEGGNVPLAFHPSCRPTTPRGAGGRFTAANTVGRRMSSQSAVHDSDAVSNAKSSGREGRRNLQRRQFAEYMQHRRVDSGQKTRIPTDENRDVVGLRTVFHNAIRDIAG
jgi:hypothetical protein